MAVPRGSVGDYGNTTALEMTIDTITTWNREILTKTVGFLQQSPNSTIDNAVSTEHPCDCLSEWHKRVPRERTSFRCLGRT